MKDGSYNPLARPIFIYVNAKSMRDKPALVKFATYYLENAEDLVRMYTRLANQARQAELTQEISEIVSGADALAS